MFFLKCFEIDIILIINKYYFCVLNLVFYMNVNWNLFKIIFRGEVGGGGGLNWENFKGGVIFVLVIIFFVVFCFLVLKFENEKLDIFVFWGLSIKDVSFVYIVSCL